MAHKKAGGSSRNGRDSAGRRLGVKLFGGQKAKGGAISFASVARNITPAKMSASARIIRCFRRSRVLFRSATSSGGRMFVSVTAAASK